MKDCLDYIEGLHPDFVKKIPDHFRITDRNTVRGFLKTRDRFSNKGDFGTGALIAGSKGMMGAAALGAMAFMRSGAGKLICHIPACGYEIMQVTVPEAMAKTEPGEDHIASVANLSQYDAVGIGPGIGLYESHEKMLADVFSKYKKPMVVDADALNTISKNKILLTGIPHHSIITPHPKEFERLFGQTESNLDRIHLALNKAHELNIIIVLKGAFTLIATPMGTAHFNTTGNAGMATGGSGDVLTGILTGLLSQKYDPQQAAILGVYVHGLAGDIASAALSQEAMIAGDINNYLGKAFKMLRD